MTRTEEFDSAIARLTDVERQADYGHPLDNFARISLLKQGVAACKDDEIRHALEMICVKMSRLVETPNHSDSIQDGAGYFRTIAMILDERDRRAAGAGCSITDPSGIIGRW